MFTLRSKHILGECWKHGSIPSSPRWSLWFDSVCL